LLKLTKLISFSQRKKRINFLFFIPFYLSLNLPFFSPFVFFWAHPQLVRQPRPRGLCAQHTTARSAYLGQAPSAPRPALLPFCRALPSLARCAVVAQERAAIEGPSATVGRLFRCSRRPRSRGHIGHPQAVARLLRPSSMPSRRRNIAAHGTEREQTAAAPTAGDLVRDLGERRRQLQEAVTAIFALAEAVCCGSGGFFWLAASREACAALLCLPLLAGQRGCEPVRLAGRASPLHLGWSSSGCQAPSRAGVRLKPGAAWRCFLGGLPRTRGGRPELIFRTATKLSLFIFFN
jgi:hypothetical protein